jgi:glycosyltransferase involved in cell wall biosynthesis
LAACSVAWVDSLYLAELPALRRRLPPEIPLGLIAHYLPSWSGQAWPFPLSAAERDALANSSGAIAPSATMAELLGHIEARLPVAVVAPGVQRSRGPRAQGGPLEVLMAANLTPNKGVLPFLEQLERQLEGADAARFRLQIAGRADVDPGYAAACHERVAAGPLALCVRLLGWLAPDALLAQMGKAHVFVSASRVESFGMAVADAVASGMVVLARRAGHVQRLVDEAHGGCLVADDGALAAALLALAREPREYARRRALAEGVARAERSYAEVAREFLDAERSLFPAL